MSDIFQWMLINRVVQTLLNHTQTTRIPQGVNCNPGSWAIGIRVLKAVIKLSKVYGEHVTMGEWADWVYSDEVGLVLAGQMGCQHVEGDVKEMSSLCAPKIMLHSGFYLTIDARCSAGKTTTYAWIPSHFEVDIRFGLSKKAYRAKTKKVCVS